jgi:hypothetical protein
VGSFWAREEEAEEGTVQSVNLTVAGGQPSACVISGRWMGVGVDGNGAMRV